MKNEKIFTKKDLKAFGDFGVQQGKIQAQEEILEWINVFKEKALWNRMFSEGKGYNAGAYIILEKLEEKIKGGIKEKNERSLFSNKDR